MDNPSAVVQIYLAISASAGSGRAVPVGVGTAVVGAGDRCSSYDGLRTVGTAVRRSAAWPSGDRHPRRARSASAYDLALATRLTTGSSQ